MLNKLLFGQISGLDILYFDRRVGGFDHWPRPVMGDFAKPIRLTTPTDTEVERDWQEFLSTNQTYIALMQMDRFKGAYTEFKNVVGPSIKREIRYFHIVSHAIYIYLLELGDPKFMGFGTRRKRQKALRHVEHLLDLIRDGLHFGTLGFNDNQQLALMLERYRHNLMSENSPRNDETVRERRFIKHLIHEFLTAFNDPLQKTITNFYYIVSRPTDEITASKLITTYIAQAQAERLEPGLPTSASWYQEHS